MEGQIFQTKKGPSDPWEVLKPFIEQLWLVEKRKLPDLIEEMKASHNFDRFDREYKYHFKKWGWKRNVPKAKMIQATQQYESRAQAGKHSTVIKYHGQVIDSHKIRRELKNQARANVKPLGLNNATATGPPARGPALPMMNTFFLKWNLPFEALAMSHSKPFDHVSPIYSSAQTPGSDIAVGTPSSAESPRDAPSPTAMVLKKKIEFDRAQLFVQGAHDKLLSSLNGAEKRVMSDWLYQYWFFSFKTAKHWGKGPVSWTRELLDFGHFGTQPRSSLPGTPQDGLYRLGKAQNDELLPLKQCRWFIHLSAESVPPYEVIEEDEPDMSAVQEFNDEITWQSWPQNQSNSTVSDRLRDALEHNDFSTTPTSALPVAIPQIAKAAEKSPNELLLESLGFSIMSRNNDQAVRIANSAANKNIEFQDIHPLHLPIDYIDGYKTCCSILNHVGSAALMSTPPAELWLDAQGHTVIDSLMMAILKSHSTATPGIVDENLKDRVRFAGEEVDICGRWDADSPCVRHLLASGNPAIPSTWKHNFCHTSVQAIWHCLEWILAIFEGTQLVEGPSGLYVRYCVDCGLKLEMLPLHALVMTAFNLAQFSVSEHEDLFGMLACLLCMIAKGLDPRKPANITTSAFLGGDNMQLACDHEELTAADFAEKLSTSPLLNDWGVKARLGWEVFCGILRLCEINNEDLIDSDDDDTVCVDALDRDEFFQSSGDFRILQNNHRIYHWTPIIFRVRKDLATLWASIQAEILTYRRLDDEADEISEHFSMEDLRCQIENGLPLVTGFVKKDLLKAHCICGTFKDHMATLSDATSPDIANLDIWHRATYKVWEDNERV